LTNYSCPPSSSVQLKMEELRVKVGKLENS
jgi:hypothetical protein